MTSASKTTFCNYDLKILRTKVTKNLTNLHKKFCEFPSCSEFRQFYTTQPIKTRYLTCQDLLGNFDANKFSKSNQLGYCEQNQIFISFSHHY